MSLILMVIEVLFLLQKFVLNSKNNMLDSEVERDIPSQDSALTDAPEEESDKGLTPPICMARCDRSHRTKRAANNEIPRHLQTYQLDRTWEHSDCDSSYDDLNLSQYKTKYQPSSDSSDADDEHDSGISMVSSPGNKYMRKSHSRKKFQQHTRTHSLTSSEDYSPHVEIERD